VNYWTQDNLTLKQREYIALLASGLSTLEIAAACFVSHHTVRNTIAKAKERIGAKSTANLVAVAVQKGWVLDVGDGPPYGFRPNI
jgi:DNA-binding CsgD family transcriptional regulator